MLKNADGTFGNAAEPMALAMADSARQWGTDRAELVYGQTAQGEIVHISSVERGRKCECVCPGCGRPLIAKTKAEKHVAHFAHAGPQCGGAPETALHKLAKQIVATELSLLLPARVAIFGERREQLSPPTEIAFDSAHVEHNLRDTISDLYLVHRGRSLVVEIAVTHKCGEEKVERLRRNGIAAIEIDLSKTARDAWLEDVRDAVLKSAPRSWIFNRGIDDRVASMRAEAVREEEEQERKLEAQAETLAEIYISAKSKVFQRFERNRHVQFLEHVGCTSAVGIELDGNAVFAVSSVRWQSAVLLDVLFHRKLGKNLQTPVSVCHYLESIHFIRRDFRSLPETIEERITRRQPDFRSPWRVVGAYLDFLTERGIAAHLMKGYTIAPAVNSRWIEASWDLELARVRIDTAPRR